MLLFQHYQIKNLIKTIKLVSLIHKHIKLTIKLFRMEYSENKFQWIKVNII